MIILAYLLLTAVFAVPQFLVFIDWDRTLGPYDSDRAWDAYQSSQNEERHERAPLSQEAQIKINRVLQKIVELGGQSFILTAGGIENLCPGGKINTIHECLIPRDHLLTTDARHKNEEDYVDRIPMLKTKLMKEKAQSLGVKFGELYFVDDNEQNIREASKNGIQTIHVGEEFLQASFSKKGNGIYGDPEEEKYYGHLSELVKILETKYPDGRPSDISLISPSYGRGSTFEGISSIEGGSHSDCGSPRTFRDISPKSSVNSMGRQFDSTFRHISPKSSVNSMRRTKFMERLSSHIGHENLERIPSFTSERILEDASESSVFNGIITEPKTSKHHFELAPLFTGMTIPVEPNKPLNSDDTTFRRWYSSERSDASTTKDGAQLLPDVGVTRPKSKKNTKSEDTELHGLRIRLMRSHLAIETLSPSHETSSSSSSSITFLKPPPFNRFGRSRSKTLEKI